jgi:pimeloyl-ACP methyl ester carboxylesterase
MSKPIPRRRAWPAALSTMLAIGAVPALQQAGAVSATAARSGPAATQVDAPIPGIAWRACSDGLQCATVHVPLDYDDPAGPKTELAIAKRPAQDLGQRVGTLFVNPGGPGDSAAASVPWFAQNLPREVVRRFDVVGIDPRGVGGSTPLRCRTDDAVQPPQEPFPSTMRQVGQQLRYDSQVRRACAEGGNRIIHHMSTADTARDMDLIRQALGESRLSYYGISYGTYLGATYAAMFPGRIRTMAVDGVIDPIAYATGHRPGEARHTPVTTRWNSAAGAYEALTAAFAECDKAGPERCPIAGRSAATWQRVIERLQRGPVRLDGEPFTYQDMVGRAEAGLRGDQEYLPLMRFIGETHEAIFGGATGAARPAPSSGRPARPNAQREPLQPATAAIVCADSRNPANPRAWIGAGARSDHRSPWFGRMWTWRSSLCAGWPGSSADAFQGPFQTRTSAPVLVIGTTHDPATPIIGARTLNGLLKDSRLLTVDGWGHGALGESSCLGTHVRNYLISGTPPQTGTVCRQDVPPFPEQS